MNSKRWLIKLLTSQIYSQKAFTLSFQYCLRVLPGGNLSQPSSMVSSKQFEAKQLQSCMPPQTGYQLAPFVMPFLKFPAAMSQLFRFLSVMLAWQQAKNCAISLRKKAPILLLLKLIILFMFVFLLEELVVGRCRVLGLVVIRVVVRVVHYQIAAVQVRRQDEWDVDDPASHCQRFILEL